MKRLVLTLLAISLILAGACGPPSAAPSQIEHSVQPPRSPTNLISEPISQNIVSLEWSDNANNEDGFRIYRDGSIIATLRSNSTIYQDTGLEAGKTYRYSVTAYNEAGESGACSYTAKTLNPPLNVTINHIGVKFDHDPIGPGDIRLFVLVSDGNSANDVEQIIPPGEGTYELNDYETAELNQRIFHTASAGEYLKIVIIAYEDDEGSLSNLIRLAFPVLGPLLGIPYAGEISAVFSQYEEQEGKPLFEDKDDYVGYFQGFWGSDESWGIGQYNAVGTEDFRVWLSIWSDSEPEPMTKPTLAFVVNFDGWYVGSSEVTTASKDNTVIARISLTGGDSGQYKVRIRRDIRWAADETIDELTFSYDGVSATKELSFSPLYATDEASTDGYLIDLTKDGYTVWDMVNAYPPRLRVSAPTVMYSLNLTINPVGSGSVSLSPSGGIYSNGTMVTLTASPSSGYQFSSWSGDISGTNPVTMVTMNSDKTIIANFTTGPLLVTFNGWYVEGSEVTTASKDDTVIARISLTGGDSGQYTIRIRRDIRWAADETIDELTFNYDGVSATKELSFSPLYATDEASTDGYLVDLMKDGYTVWDMVNAYPPRLRATVP